MSVIDITKFEQEVLLEIFEKQFQRLSIDDDMNRKKKLRFCDNSSSIDDKFCRRGVRTISHF